MTVRTGRLDRRRLEYAGVCIHAPAARRARPPGQGPLVQCCVEEFPVCNSSDRARGSNFAVSEPHPLDFLPRIASLPPPPPEAVQVLVPRRPRAHSSRLDEPRQAAAASPQPVRFQELRKKRWPAGRAGGGAVALLRAMIVGLPGTRRWSRACGQGRPRSEPEAEASCSPAFTPSAFNAGSRDCTV